jgi:hypothetical protein
MTVSGGKRNSGFLDPHRRKQTLAGAKPERPLSAKADKSD